MRFLYLMLSIVLITSYEFVLYRYGRTILQWEGLPDHPNEFLILIGPFLYAWFYYNFIPLTRYRRLCTRYGLFTPTLWIHAYLMIFLIAFIPHAALKITLFHYTGMAIVGFALGYVHSTFWPFKPWSGRASFYKSEAEFRRAHPEA